MRIAHVTATFPPYYGGTGNVCYHNALGLAELGHNVTVLTARHPPGDPVYPPEIAVRRLPVLFRLGNAPLLLGLLRIKDVDIIHLHHPFIFGAEMVWLVSKLRRIPYVITHHNDLIGIGLRRILFGVYAALSTRLVVGAARKIVVVSTDHAESCRLAPLYRKRWEDVVEIPNGVDTTRFCPELDGTLVRRRLGIPEGTGVLLYVGAMDRAHHYKGVAYLLRAIAKMWARDAVLVLVGEGELKKQYMALADELNIGSRTCFVGAKTPDELGLYYAAADVVILPSSSESFGLVLIEAMACGRPVVAHDIPGVRTVVSDGQDGLLTRPGDIDDLVAKMQTLLDDPQRRREMGERGRAKVEAKYTWSEITPLLVKMYEQVLESTR